jgi:anti-sigma regulatory factor (Ser/Thr protein kinase)
MRHPGPEPLGFRHEALFYGGTEELLEGTVPPVRDAVAAGAEVLVALPDPHGRLLREALGPDADAVSFADMEELGRNPGRIISAWRDFVTAGENGDRQLLGIGEPAWPGRTDAEFVECDRHEALLNVAFAEARDFRLLCPYDRGRLPDEVLEDACRNHPRLIENGEHRRNGTYALRLPGDTPLADPAAQPLEVSFGTGDLHTVRELLAEHGRRAGLRPDRIGDLVLAVDELATNSLRYAAGEHTLRTWQENGSLLAEVADGGHIADPLAGRTLPGPGELHGRGLWLVNQLCDLVQLRSSPMGSVVRVHVHAG